MPLYHATSKSSAIRDLPRNSSFRTSNLEIPQKCLGSTFPAALSFRDSAPKGSKTAISPEIFAFLAPICEFSTLSYVFLLLFRFFLFLSLDSNRATFWPTTLSLPPPPSLSPNGRRGLAIYALEFFLLMGSFN